MRWPESWTFMGLMDEGVTFLSLLKMYVMLVPLLLAVFALVAAVGWLVVHVLSLLHMAWANAC